MSQATFNLRHAVHGAVLSILALSLPLGSSAQRVKYWVGGSGAWSDAAHWSLTPQGMGGAGAPRISEGAVLAPATATTITVDADANVLDLLLDGSTAALELAGGSHASLRIAHDLRARGQVNDAFTGTTELVADGGAELDLRGIPMAGDLLFNGNGAWSSLTDVRTSGALVLREGSLITNGNHVVCDVLRISGSGTKRLIAGASVVDVLTAIDAGGAAHFVEPSSSALVVAGVQRPWGALAATAEEDARGISICGTGVGQTPFTINAQVLTNFNGFNISCSGACNAVVTVSVTGGVGPFAFNWSGGPNAQTWTNTCVGNKLVIVTDLGQGIGCAATVQVTGPPPLGVIFFPALTPPTCAQVCNGTGNALAVGGTGSGYIYNWNNGAGSNATFNQLCAGANTLQIHDQNNCVFDTTFTINLQPISPNLVVLASECNGGCDGGATVTPSGGTGTYTYAWEPGTPQGDGTNTVSSLCAGNYSVTVTDVNGCDTTLQFVITQPPPIVPNTVVTNATCWDVCNGVIVLSPSGAVGPYQYIWTPPPGAGQFTNTASQLCAGTYNCTIIDSATGCDTLITAIVGAPPAIVPNPTSTNVTCNGLCNGTAGAAPSGGTPGYTYLWTPVPPVGQSTPNASQLCPGTWTLVITDAAGCDTTVQYTITAPPPILPNEAHTDITCSGACDGTATVNPTGGSGALTFDWGPGTPQGDGTPSVSQLCAGVYTCAITDAAGCDTIVSITILAPLPIQATATITPVSCGTLCDGEVLVAATGGTGGYTYQWTPQPGGGQGTANATGLCAGVWSLLITDANGCTLSQSFTIAAPLPLNVSVLVANATCPDFCNGSATATVTGGNDPYSYLWFPAPGGGQGTAVATGLCASTYTLTVSDSVACDTTIQVTITAPLPIVPNATVVPPTCFGQCNGSITLAPVGGTGTFTYLWSPQPGDGQNTASVTGLCSGTWQVIVTSGVCDTTLIFQLNAPPPIDAALTTTPVTCSNACDGTATSNASGGTPGFTYLWTPAPGAGQGTPNATQMCAGGYTLSITDAAGCDTLIPFTIDQPPAIVPNLSTTIASCGGACDASAAVAPTGGSGPFTITWSPEPGGGQNTNLATGLCPGVWSVTLLDSAGCDTTIQFLINTPSGIVASAQVTPASCADVCDGAITLTVSGGQPSYSYVWSPTPPNNGGNVVSGLCAGDWTVVISDQASCDTVMVINVPSPTAIVPNGSFTNESCNGPCDGTATVSPTGGTGVYTYLWTPQPGAGQGTPTAGGLCAGDWSVLITDGGGCDTLWRFTILPEQPIVLNLNVVDILCSDVCNGSASVSPTGGIGGYTYSWSPTPSVGQGTASVSGLCIGQWIVTITDDAGCDTIVPFIVFKPAPLNPNLVVANATCDGVCTGQAGVFPAGGTAPFTFHWEPEPIIGQGTNIADSLCAGSTYSITITDAHLCDTTLTFTVPDFVPLSPIITATDASCNGVCDGTIGLQVSGGFGPYTFDWSPQPASGQGTATATGLCAGTWIVTIADANFCDTMISIIIHEPPIIDPVATVENVSCAGACNGMITLAPSGGAGSYVYNWAPVPPNGQGTNIAQDLCPGVWTVTIASPAGCDTTVSFTITEPAPLAAAVDVVASQCQLCIGSITVRATGGTPGNTFIWGPPVNVTTPDSVQAGLCAGIYSVTVQDAAGCSVALTVPISDSDGEVLAVTNDTTSCPVSCDGTVQVDFNCSQPTCTVAWFDGSGTDLNASANTLTDLCAGIYLVEVTNGGGCISIDTALVVAPDPIVASISTTPVSCANACNGSAAVGITGGIAPYTISWSPAPATGQGTTTVTGLCAGVYDVTITDASGCSLLSNVLILGPQPIAVAASITPITCAGQCDASIALNTSGGTGAFAYIWDPVPPNGQGTASALTLCPGDWHVTVMDSNGCDTTLTYNIPAPQPIALSASGTPSQCGVCNGTATAVVGGGSGIVLVTWTDAFGVIVGTGNALTDLCAGLYTATATDANGCSRQTTVAVPDSDGEAVSTTNGQTTCANNCDGAVSVTFSCTDGPCEMVWYTMDGTEIALNQFVLDSLCVGDYLVVVTNGAGCVTIDTASVVPSQTILPNLSTVPETCAGACDGIAAVGPIGGIAPYTYSWSPVPPAGQGTSQASGLCPGAWSVTIADSLGCDTTVTALILGPQPIMLGANIQGVSCSGVCDGTIDVVSTGGTGPLTFTWSPVPPAGQGTASVSQLCAGDWTVLVTDANGCSLSATYTVIEPQPITLSITTTPSNCGVCIGTAEVDANGGTAPYAYSWSISGAVFGTDSSLTDICAGLYTLTVTDAHGCQAQQQVPIVDSDGEVLAATSDTVTCPGDCDGAVEVVFNCSVPTCSITWFDAFGVDQNEPDNALDSLCAGVWFVQVTNGNGCISIDTAMVVSPAPIVANLSTSAVTCAGACNGSATVAPTGGVGNYDYAWDPLPPVGQGTPTASDLCAGTWSVTITDDGGCSIIADALITEPAPFTVTAVVDSVSCNGVCDGGITIDTQGGNGSYVWTWTPTPPVGQGTQQVQQLCAGDWSVLISDVNGCDTTITYTITEPTSLVAEIDLIENICYGACDGSAWVSISGGTPGYDVVWINSGGITVAQGDTLAEGLCSDTYAVIVTDANGCQLPQNFVITQGLAIDAGLVFQGETCNGPCDGTASVSPSGGAGGPFTIVWSPEPGTGQGTEQAGELCAGNWTVTITDPLGCDTTYAFTVLPYTPITPVVQQQNISCNAACDGSITLTTAGGVGTLTYTWTPEPPVGQGTSSISQLCAGDWTVIIADAVACDTTITYTITEPAVLASMIDQVTDASCNTANDGAIAITLSGGTLPYTVSWNGPNAFASDQEDITALFPGVYTVLVTDAHGCGTTQQVTVNALSTVVAFAGADATVCAGGSITLDGSASTGANFQWTDDQSNVVGNAAIVTLGSLPVGTHVFTLTVTDPPCSSTDQVIITVLELPLANAGPDQSIFLLGTVTLGGQPSGPAGSTFSWQPDTLFTNASTSNPPVSPDVTTWFVLTVTTPNGCASIDSALVTVIPEIKIPSGFTPNSDGSNDAWQIDYIDQFPDCTVEIYNRWGELLFRSVGYKEPWDGTYSGGLVPVGTYYYAIELNDERFPEPYTGPLTVIR